MATGPTELQLAQVAAVLGPGAAQFEALINTLMSPSNDQRAQAESLFNLCKQIDSETLSLKLCHVFSSSSPNPGLGAMSAILFRNFLTPNNTNNNTFLFPSLSPQTQSKLKSYLLNSIVNQTAESINKQLCHTVSELAASLLPENKWPEFLPFLFKSVASDNIKSVLLIVAQLTEYRGKGKILTELEYFHDKLVLVIQQGLKQTAGWDVRIAALGATSNFIQYLEEKDWDKFQHLLTSMMSTLNDALDCGNELAVGETLKLLIELMETKRWCLRMQIVEIVETMLQIADDDSLEEGTRHLAIEFILTLAEVEKEPGLLERIKNFEILVKKMLEDINDDVDNAYIGDNADNEEIRDYGFGQERLDTLSLFLGENRILPVTLQVAQTYLDAPEWQKHLAALIALSQIIPEKTCPECAAIYGSEELPQKLEVQSKDHKLMLASKIMTDYFHLKHKVVTNSFQQLVSMVLSKLEDDRHPRVWCATIYAIRQLVMKSSFHLQDECHRVLPALAKAMDDFQNPRVQTDAIVAVIRFSDYCDVRGYLSRTIGSSRVLLKEFKWWRPKSRLLYLRDIYVCKLSQAWDRLCKCPRRDLSPLLNILMPSLLLAARLDPDVELDFYMPPLLLANQVDPSVKEDFPWYTRLRIEDIIEEKTMAFHILCCCVDELEEGLLPWIFEVAEAMVALLQCYYVAEFRRIAASVMPQLLLSAKQSQDHDESSVKQLSDYLRHFLLEALRKELDPEVYPTIWDSWNECKQVVN